MKFIINRDNFSHRNPQISKCQKILEQQDNFLELEMKEIMDLGELTQTHLLISTLNHMINL